MNILQLVKLRKSKKLKNMSEDLGTLGPADNQAQDFLSFTPFSWISVSLSNILDRKSSFKKILLYFPNQHGQRSHCLLCHRRNWGINIFIANVLFLMRNEVSIPTVWEKKPEKIEIKRKENKRKRKFLRKNSYPVRFSILGLP